MLGKRFNIRCETRNKLGKRNIICRCSAHGIPYSNLPGEKELSTQTLQAAEMDVNMTYQVPDGTDNVKVVSFDAEGNIIEQEILKSGNYVYNVWYDIGGFFLGYKALNLKWP